jgi:hypothetical protein
MATGRGALGDQEFFRVSYTSTLVVVTTAPAASRWMPPMTYTLPLSATTLCSCRTPPAIGASGFQPLP